MKALKWGRRAVQNRLYDKPKSWYVQILEKQRAINIKEPEFSEAYLAFQATQVKLKKPGKSYSDTMYTIRELMSTI